MAPQGPLQGFGKTPRSGLWVPNGRNCALIQVRRGVAWGPSSAFNSSGGKMTLQNRPQGFGKTLRSGLWLPSWGASWGRLGSEKRIYFFWEGGKMTPLHQGDRKVLAKPCGRNCGNPQWAELRSNSAPISAKTQRLVHRCMTCIGKSLI